MNGMTTKRKRVEADKIKMIKQLNKVETGNQLGEEVLVEHKQLTYHYLTVLYNIKANFVLFTVLLIFSELICVFL